MADNETIADIIAEMRALSNPISDSIIAINGRSIADRLEAAFKREKATAKKSSTVGNAAKLREALEACVAEMCDRCRELAAARGNPLPCLSGCEPVRKAKFALAAPPRNCDVGTAEEQAKRFFVFCDSNKCSSCPCRFTRKTDCALIWAQMPYEEGGVS